MKTVSRYHPLLVILHWLVALLLIGMLALGFFWLRTMPSTDPRKLDILEVHMAAGMLILALMAVRFILRLMTAHPAPASTGRPGLDRAAPILHYGFYVIVLLMVGSGYGTGLLAGLPAIVFARSGEPLPASFADYPSFTVHALLAAILAGAIALHVLAALYHQLVRKDRLLARMSLGRRAG